MGDCNISLFPIDRSSKQKLNRKNVGANKCDNQMDQIDIYRTFH